MMLCPKGDAFICFISSPGDALVRSVPADPSPVWPSAPGLRSRCCADGVICALDTARC